MDLIWFLVIVVIVAILISIVYQVFNVGELFVGMSRTQRLLIALLGILLIIGIIWYVFFAGHLVRLP